MMQSPNVSLPPLWQKPSFECLLSCLESLRVKPPTWTPNVSSDQNSEEPTTPDQREETAYLSAIIRSKLSWMADDEQRERIWEEASKRTAERCGRAAMGEMLRSWPLENGRGEAFALTLREPPLTGDALGLKTWGSSYVMARMLRGLAADALSHLFTPPPPSSSSSPDVLELGSGTGLLGLAAACVWSARVVLTDLPGIVTNLAHNVAMNQAVVHAQGGTVEAAVLTWGGSGDEVHGRFRREKQFKLVLAADPLYEDGHPRLLASTVDAQLSACADARALVMVPLRDETTRGLLGEFRSSMARLSHAMVCVREGTEVGQDDWGDRPGDGVECWWGVFQRARDV